MSSNNLQNYKATFIFDTRNYQEPVEKLIERISDLIQSLEGAVKKVQNLGQKDFERVTDRKFPAGIYVQYFIEAPASLPATIKEKLRLDRTVDRILFESI